MTQQQCERGWVEMEFMLERVFERERDREKQWEIHKQNGRFQSSQDGTHHLRPFRGD